MIGIAQVTRQLKLITGNAIAQNISRSRIFARFKAIVKRESGDPYKHVIHVLYNTRACLCARARQVEVDLTKMQRVVFSWMHP